jgi:hypothetical protein
MKTLFLRMICALATKIAIAYVPQLPIFDAHIYDNIEVGDYFPPEKLFVLFNASNVTSMVAKPTSIAF